MRKKLVVFLTIFIISLIGILLAIKFVNFDVFPFKMVLNGEDKIKINLNEEYIDEGVEATLFWINLNNKVKVESNVDNTIPGNYLIKYSYNGKIFKKSLERQIIVIDNVPPVLTLENDKITIYTNGIINVGKIKAEDNIDGDISKNVIVDSLDTSKSGKYKLKVSVKDSSGNETTKTINVTIKDKPIKNGTVNARIDVYISEQKLYYYEGNKLVLTSDVVTGKNDGTPRGHYKVLSKKKDVYLKGKNYLDHVDYWIAFIGRVYGIHDASWRSEFGGSIYKTDGSHGCVNMPTNKIKELYERVKVGTAVNIYS